MDVTDVFFKKPSCEKNLELPHHWRFKGNAAETLLKGGAIPQCIPPHRGREAPHYLTIFEMQCPRDFFLTPVQCTSNIEISSDKIPFGYDLMM